MLNIPQALSDLSLQWLSEALGAPLTDYKVVDAHAGTTGRAVLELQSTQSANIPARLFVKLPPTDETQRAFVTSSGMGQREARFYQALAAELPIRVPKCYYSASDEAGEKYIMLLEHLVDSDCEFNNARNRYSAQYIRQVLTAFAQLHAAYWNSPRFESDLSWIQPPLQHDIALPLIAQALEKYADTMPPVFRNMGELYLQRTDDIHQLWNRGVPTLIHGDVHDGNLFFDTDAPGFLDWAVVAKGPAMRDVGYFLAGMLRPDHQRDWGADMLTFYREQLLAFGAAAPSTDELWQQYQWHAAYVWLGAAVTLAMGDEWQPVNYVMASLKRLHTSLEYLGSVEAIRSAL